MKIIIASNYLLLAACALCDSSQMVTNANLYWKMHNHGLPQGKYLMNILKMEGRVGEKKDTKHSINIDKIVRQRFAYKRICQSLLFPATLRPQPLAFLEA